MLVLSFLNISVDTSRVAKIARNHFSESPCMYFRRVRLQSHADKVVCETGFLGGTGSGHGGKD